MIAKSHETLKSAIETALPSIWVVALIAAAVAAVPISLARSTAPTAIIYPVLIGGAFSVAAAVFQSRKPVRAKSDGHLETVGARFTNFAELTDVAVVELTVPAPKNKQQEEAQLELGLAYEKVRPKQEKFRIFRTAEGKQLIAIDCDRFSGMLTSEALSSFDATIERSLEATLLRLSGSAIPREHLHALIDETLKDLLKADIRGNLAAYLAKTNDHIFKRVMDELRNANPEKNKGREPGKRAVKASVTVE